MRPIAEFIDLSGKVAIVTGGAMGIGEAIARRLAEAGAHVVIASRTIESAEATAASIRAGGGRASSHVADVCVKADTDALAAHVDRELGGIDIVVNNAGIMPPGLALDIEEADWNRVVDTSLKGMFFLSQAAARTMVARKRGGAIVNLSSINALVPTGALAHYDAAKAGVIGLTRSLAKEWGPQGIRVNAMAPGNVLTPGGLACAPDLLRALGAPEGADVHDYPPRTVLGRFGQPDELARVALFLASPMSSFMTGSLVLVDGGAMTI